MKPLPAAFYGGSADAIAPALLNKVLVCGGVSARIVEVEAYCGHQDPGSHAFRGPTKRNATMFGPPGRLYVYFTYGMHWCANVVCSPAGEASAVLFRALEPLTGLEVMRVRRPKAKSDRDLCRGPARLAEAFAIDGEFDGHDVTKRSSALPWIGDDGTAPPDQAVQSVRIGLSKGADIRWRWHVPHSRFVSR
ncbi:MAG: DNA-3-methyladenine glycosylase [Acidimicrobiia bacterium]